MMRAPGLPSGSDFKYLVGAAIFYSAIGLLLPGVVMWEWADRHALSRARHDDFEQQGKAAITASRALTEQGEMT